MGIKELMEEHKSEIRKRFGVRKIGLFGSWARGEETMSSDVDILVEFERPTFDNFMDLLFYLEELLDRNVDLVTTKGLSPYISEYVYREVVWVV